MKKTILAVAWISVLSLPCALVFCIERETPLGLCMTLIGIVYSAILYKYHHLMIPGWVRDKVDNLVREDRMFSPD